MPPKKRPGPHSDATENVSWTDDEVEHLLAVSRSYSSQNYDYEGLARYNQVRIRKLI